MKNFIKAKKALGNSISTYRVFERGDAQFSPIQLLIMRFNNVFNC